MVWIYLDVMDLFKVYDVKREFKMSKDEIINFFSYSLKVYFLNLLFLLGVIFLI